MKKFYKIFIAVFTAYFCILPTANLFAQTFEWAKQMGGTGRNVGHSIAIDNWGNVYTKGFFLEQPTLTLGRAHTI